MLVSYGIVGDEYVEDDDFVDCCKGVVVVGVVY